MIANREVAQTNALRVIAAAQAYEIVRREAIKVERQFNNCDNPTLTRALREQLYQLRDREAHLLQIITEEEL